MSGFIESVAFEGAKKKMQKTQLIYALHPQTRQNHRGQRGVQGARAFSVTFTALQAGGREGADDPRSRIGEKWQRL